MFEIVVSDRFAAWYEGLPESAAEEVTLALEVAAGLGPAVDPELGREVLLWYDGAHTPPVSPEAAALVERFSRLVWWGRRVSQSLESPAFAERLAELDAPRARDALLAVERVKNLLASARLLAVLGAIDRPPGEALGAGERWLLDLILLERERAAIVAGDASLQRPPTSGESHGRLQLAVLEVMRLVGLSPRLVFDEASGLREITVELEGWRARLIVGVDVAQQRLIAILGEPLDRVYYGDSVKFAEAFFRDDLARQEKRSVAAP